MKLKLLSPLVMLLGSGCATLFSDSSDKITITSEPAGAEVILGNEVKGKTPLELVVERDTFKTTTLQIKKKGYATQDLKLKKTFNTTSLFNIGFISTTLGVTSWGVDALTGGVIKHSPTGYTVTLKKGDSAQLDAGVGKTLFVQVNEQKIRNDLAHGGGAFLDTYLSFYGFNEVETLMLKEKVLASKMSLLKLENAIVLEAAIEKMASHQKQLASL
jgi:hypothetical protein